MSNKRNNNDVDAVVKPKVKKQAHGVWNMGLVASMEDPAYIVEQDELVTVIRDKYPKAEHHFLVLPKESIPNLAKLKPEHLDLLRHMEKVGEKVASSHPTYEFRVGYHAVPSMTRVHLHVISDDFNSPCLKTKKHWNSFVTDFFLPSKKVKNTEVVMDTAIMTLQLNSTIYVFKNSLTFNTPELCDYYMHTHIIVRSKCDIAD